MKNIQQRRNSGLLLGLFAAVGYSCANLALRSVSAPNDPAWAMWVSCNKAVPVFFVAWILIGIGVKRGRPDALPPRTLLLPMIVAALVMQFGGNVMFQWALGLGGLVLCVPMLFATLIITGAIAGQVFLNDRLTPRTSAALLLLIVAVVVLSIGASAATGRVMQDTSFTAVASACVISAIAGIAYGANGVFIRHLTAVRQLPIATSLVMYSTVGVATLGLGSLLFLGADRMLATTQQQWTSFYIAGGCNAVAFFALGAAFRRATVNQVNLVNASQNAMCALGGILFFAEPVTIWLEIGCGLTIIGILMIDNKRQQPTDSTADIPDPMQPNESKQNESRPQRVRV